MHSFNRYKNTAGEYEHVFEIFNQHGSACFTWSLPKSLVQQAFLTLCNAYKTKGIRVGMQHVRGFLLGTKGQSIQGPVEKKCPDEFNWPQPPDDSWKLVVCHYPDGLCDLDFVNKSTRSFWSESHGFLTLPSYDPELMGRWWFRLMGIPVMEMHPSLSLLVERKRVHLNAIR